MPTRRTVLGALSVLAAPLTAGRTSPASARTHRVIRGADLSSLLEVEAVGARFRDGDRSAPVEQLLAARGADAVRLRLWVDPASAHGGLASALALARRSRDVGLRVLLDLHYSDTWADRSNQIVPARWLGLCGSGLVEAVRAYTREVVEAFAGQGTPVEMIQIGNEVTSGMLWPHGQIYREGHEHWTDFVELVNAGVQGAREGGDPRVVLHIDRGGDNGGARYFYDHVTAAGTDFDVIALSYYPFWHGSLAVLQDNLADLAARYGKDVLVAETSYPWFLPWDDGPYFVSRPDQLPDGARFPATPQGQAAYFEALRAVVDAVPDGRGLGFLAWEPAWLPGMAWEHGEENPYGNLTMFDRTGEGLSSLAAFRR
jgi:arabinogalactan endo-1,4-beta-galactosidase